MKFNPKILAESLIPILGYVFWEWSIHFVVMFCILDMLAKEILFHLKVKKILETQGTSKKTHIRKAKMVSVFIFISSIVLSELLAFIIVEDYSFTNEAYAFWMLEDTGLPQGYFLLPLLLLMVWMDYKLTFLKFKLHMKMNLMLFAEDHVRNNAAFLMTLALLTMSNAIFLLNDWLMLGAIILGPLALYTYFKKNKK